MLVKSDIRQNKKYQYWDKAAAAFFLLVYMLLKIHWDLPSLDFKKKKRKENQDLRWRMVSPVQVLDSLGGRSSFVRDVTMEMGPSEVVLLTVLAIWPMRSSTQPADNRASASWSQHSSMVSHIWLRPCRQQPKVIYPWRKMERLKHNVLIHSFSALVNTSFYTK